MEDIKFRKIIDKYCNKNKKEWRVFFTSADMCIEILNKEEEVLYRIFSDGVCYSSKTYLGLHDLPKWVFNLRDELVENNFIG